jgi:hypothetical protein
MTPEQVETIFATCHKGRIYPQDNLCGPRSMRLVEGRAIEAARDAQWAEMLAAPHEAKTEADKTAYAFGWWKALESVREKDPLQALTDLTQEMGLYEEAQPAPQQYTDIVSDGGLDPRNKFDAQPVAQQEPK